MMGGGSMQRKMVLTTFDYYIFSHYIVLSDDNITMYGMKRMDEEGKCDQEGPVNKSE